MARRNETVGFVVRDVADAAASLVSDLATQMPEWKMADSNAFVSDSLTALGDSNEAQPGVDVATLRAKFLKDRTSTDAIPTRATTAVRRNTSVEVFKVEPKNGGPSQVAERRNGKISIVSG